MDQKREENELWSVKACPADHPGRFSVFALPLIVTPPNLQNHLTLASEGYLNNQCFGSSSRNVAVGGEVREKHNPEMSVCNGDSTSGRCRRTQTQSTVLRVIRISHEQICCCSVEGTFQLFVLAKNLLSRPPLKKMGPVFDPAKTTARTDQFKQVPYCLRWEMKSRCCCENVSCLPFVAF